MRGSWSEWITNKEVLKPQKMVKIDSLTVETAAGAHDFSSRKRSALGSQLLAHRTSASRSLAAHAGVPDFLSFA